MLGVDAAGVDGDAALAAELPTVAVITSPEILAMAGMAILSICAPRLPVTILTPNRAAAAVIACRPLCPDIIEFAPVVVASIEEVRKVSVSC